MSITFHTIFHSVVFLSAVRLNCCIPIISQSKSLSIPRPVPQIVKLSLLHRKKHREVSCLGTEKGSILPEHLSEAMKKPPQAEGWGRIAKNYSLIFCIESCIMEDGAEIYAKNRYFHKKYG